MEKLKKYGNWVMALVFVLIVIAAYKMFDNFQFIAAGIGRIFSVLSPFVTGFIIAYVLNMPCKKINTALGKSKKTFIKKRSKAISILIVYLIAALLLFVLIRTIVPSIYKNVLDLYNHIPDYFDEVMSVLEDWQNEHDITIFEVNKLNATKAFDNILSKIDITQFSKYAQGVVNVTSRVINIFIGLIISVYMLIDKEKIQKSVKRIIYIFIKKDKGDRLCAAIRNINTVFSKYVFCLILDAVIMAVLSTVILSILRVRYAIILGCMIGICNLIPYFGAIIAAVSSVVITLITGGIFKAIEAAVSLLILQQVDGNLIGPRIMGQMLNASPLWIIFAVTLGGGLFGIAGMIVSVPVLVVIKMVVTDFIKEREKGKRSE